MNTPVENAMWKFMTSQMKSDLIGMMVNQPISIMAKWLKSVNASSTETRRLGKITASMMGLTEKEYRKGLSKLRAYLDIVEKKMSAGQWNEINFENVPSVALNRYINSYNKHCAEKFAAYKQAVSKGEAKINTAALYPYNILQGIIAHSVSWSQFRLSEKDVDTILKEQWAHLPNYLENSMNVMMVADTSASMYIDDYRPLATAIGLALYFAERNTGDYHNLFMTFSNHPSIISLRDSQSFVDKINTIGNAEWGMSTDLDATYQRIYKIATMSGEAPQALCIVSDMQINQWSSQDRANSITDKWEQKFKTAGLNFPKLIYWNVCGANRTFLGGKNVSYVSGYGASVFKNFTELLECSGFEGIQKVLTKEPFCWN